MLATVLVVLAFLPAAFAQQNQIQGELPFFIFASDQVTSIKFNKFDLPCVFIATTASVADLTKIEFTQRSLSSPTPVKYNLAARMNPPFGSLCLDNEYLDISYGDLFATTTTAATSTTASTAATSTTASTAATSTTKSTAAKLITITAPTAATKRDTILYFTSKNKTNGMCSQGFYHGNVFTSLTGAANVGASVDCPAVVLTPTNVKKSVCPKVRMNIAANTVPKSGITISTPRWAGRQPQQEPQTLFSIDSSNIANYDNEVFIQSVVIISTSEKTYVDNILKISSEEDTTFPSPQCGIPREIDGSKVISGVIQSGGSEGAEFQYQLKIAHKTLQDLPKIEFFNKVVDSQATFQLKLTFSDDATKIETYTHFDRIVISDVTMAEVSYICKAEDSCAQLSLMFRTFFEAPTTSTVTTTVTATTLTTTLPSSTKKPKGAYGNVLSVLCVALSVIMILV